VKDRLFKLLGVLVLLGSFIFGWAWMSYQSFADSPLQLSESAHYFNVEQGMSVGRIAASLQKQGYIDSSRMFRWMVKISGEAQRIQAGEYLLSEGMTPAQLLENMVQGKVRQFSITLIEGRSFREMMQVINADPNLKHHLKGLSDSEIMARIGHSDEHPEGRFLPETYLFPRGLSDVEFLKRAYAALNEVLQKEWQARDVGLPLKTPYEALILASIVEKETGLESERPQIAGVFIRRLEKRMRLQTDPTVIYGLGQDFDGNLRRRDLKQDSPYNSYTRRGLPPTPIAMPGADAIRAVMHPDDGNSLYFVAKGDGSHYFSTTVEEHNRAVTKYQRGGRKRKGYTSAPPQ
jgi:UPF0755 protein